ncbi:DUF3322 and DUF2220 domain-containing protein [Actinomyces israelii]|uniref:DUF3322 and DUF2220 domain-containing protein n=1 Tax=Actinomyces israelii TaxID=1659 RepID=UPI0005BA8248|nr:DUF3322 and DUF2220 domain-containing protein [Actinomyces israelii]
MRTPQDLRSRAAAAYRRSAAAWAVDPEAAESARLVLGLAPPTEREALAGAQAVADWAAAWRVREAGRDVVVERRTRSWASLGAQQVPVRAVLTGADAIASAAGRADDWARARDRAARLLALGRAHGAGGGAERTALAAAVRSVIGAVASYENDDVERLLAALAWLADNDASGLYLRQIPIAGMDSKWLERHRRVLRVLVPVLRGLDTRAGANGPAGAPGPAGPGGLEEALGLRPLPAVCRIRLLDRGLVPGAPRDMSAPIEQIDRLWAAPSAGAAPPIPAAQRAAALPPHPPGGPEAVVVVENLATFLALEERPGAVAVWGHGYSAAALARIGWLRGARTLVYWGDLDVDGLRILAALRTAAPRARSLAMDGETLRRWRHLAVTDPGSGAGSPSGAASLRPPDRLTAPEREAWEMLVDRGLRLEQERLAWDWACVRLDAALRA